jgi:hypothetical protein
VSTSTIWFTLIEFTDEHPHEFIFGAGRDAERDFSSLNLACDTRPSPQLSVNFRHPVFMPMEETFFARRFAMLRDRFETSWMILHERAEQPN